MDRDKIIAMIQNAGTTEDEVERRTLLTDLNNNVAELFDKEKTLEEENQKLKEDNEKIRQANMELFLQVGSNKSKEETIKDETGAESKEPEKRKFEDLFDEKGGLK